MRIERPLPVSGQPPRIAELWVWTCIDPMTDTEGVISVRPVRGGTAMPLVTTMRSMAERMRPLAEAFVREAEEPRPILQLRHFTPTEEGS